MYRNFRILLIQVVFIVGVLGCAPQPEIEVGYKPPIVIPVRVSINTRGEIKVELSRDFVTPIGTFDIGGGTSISSVRQRYAHKILIVRVDDEVVAYELEEGKEFKIDFDDNNTLYKRVALNYESNGDIVLELESVRDLTSFAAPEPISQDPSGYWCDDLDGVRLSVGDDVEIVWPKVNLRSDPLVPEDFYENIVAELEEGTMLTIVGGPECAHEGTWWEIRTENGQSGWVREYTSKGYLMKP